jgi:hypothetical protein
VCIKRIIEEAFSEVVVPSQFQNQLTLFVILQSLPEDLPLSSIIVILSVQATLASDRDQKFFTYQFLGHVCSWVFLDPWEMDTKALLGRRKKGKHTVTLTYWVTLALIAFLLL